MAKRANTGRQAVEPLNRWGLCWDGDHLSGRTFPTRAEATKAIEGCPGVDVKPVPVVILTAADYRRLAANADATTTGKEK